MASAYAILRQKYNVTKPSLHKQLQLWLFLSFENCQLLPLGLLILNTIQTIPARADLQHKANSLWDNQYTACKHYTVTNYSAATSRNLLTIISITSENWASSSLTNTSRWHITISFVWHQHNTQALILEFFTKHNSITLQSVFCNISSSWVNICLNFCLKKAFKSKMKTHLISTNSFG